MLAAQAVAEKLTLMSKDRWLLDQIARAFPLDSLATYHFRSTAFIGAQASFEWLRRSGSTVLLADNSISALLKNQESLHDDDHAPTTSAVAIPYKILFFISFFDKS